MVWFKCDDKLHAHRKVRQLRRNMIVQTSERVAAIGLWTLLGTESADNLTDGFVSIEDVERYDPDQQLATALVRCGLWEQDTVDGIEGYRFHDWEQANPTREQVQNKRAATAKRTAVWRASRRGGDAGGDALRDAPCDARVQNGDRSPNPNPNPYLRDDDARSNGAPVDNSGPAAARSSSFIPDGFDPANPRCPAHAAIPADEWNPDPCGWCARLSRRASAILRDAVVVETDAKAEARLRRDLCSWCEGTNHRPVDPSDPASPVIKCDKH